MCNCEYDQGVPGKVNDLTNLTCLEYESKWFPEIIEKMLHVKASGHLLSNMHKCILVYTHVCLDDVEVMSSEEEAFN